MDIEVDIPTEPRSFTVSLPATNLKQISFSALDYETTRRAMIEYIRTYHPDDFNDFVASNGMMILMSVISAVVDSLSLRGDLRGNESFLSTAVSEEAVENHLQLIGERMRRQTAATVEIEVTIDRAAFTDVSIPAGTVVSALGPDGSEIFYEVYRGPGDWDGDIVIPAGKRGVIALGVHGRFAEVYSGTSIGGANQQIQIADNNILPDPIMVDVTYGNSTKRWRAIHEPIQKYGPRDEVVEVQFYKTLEGHPIVKFIFGDDVNGKAPVAGSQIDIRYRVGGGSVGRVAVGAISQSRSVRVDGRAIPVNYRNISPSTGGIDAETVEEAKKRAPRTYATHGVIVTAHDYVHYAENFYHPHYGKIGKASVVLDSSPNRNIATIYVLAQGQDGLPTTASVHLKTALENSISNINVATDEVRILDGVIKPIDLEAVVVMDRTSDARVVRNHVNQAVTEFFSIRNFDIGSPLYISKLIEVIERIDGIRYINLHNPNRNIIASNQLAGDQNKVGVNEIITLGSSKIDFYYDTISANNAVSL